VPIHYWWPYLYGSFLLAGEHGAVVKTDWA